MDINQINCHIRICNQLNEIYKTKNSDYGDSFHKSFIEFGITSPLIRLSDKLNRLKTLSQNKQLVNDESIRDTLLDLANYAILTIMELDNNKDNDNDNGNE